MGYRPPPPRRDLREPLTALRRVQEQYARGERDVAGLERGVEWLIRHRLEDTFQTIAPDWPPEDPDAPPTAADPLLASYVVIP